MPSKEQNDEPIINSMRKQSYPTYLDYVNEKKFYNKLSHILWGKWLHRLLFGYRYNLPLVGSCTEFLTP